MRSQGALTKLWFESTHRLGGRRHCTGACGGLFLSPLVALLCDAWLNNAMLWPVIPTCHANEPQFREYAPCWREAQPERPPHGQTFRTCFYCGSMHPEDLVAALEAGAKLGGSDWKYGWPHKFYVEVPNPLAGQIVQVGSRTEKGVTTPIMGEASTTTHAKWYNQHIEDVGYDTEALTKLLAALKEHSKIEFIFGDDGRLGYVAPHRGFQV